VPSIAKTERLALADLLDELGPDAPTLCTGWDTRSLAAHLVIRERRPDAGPGLAVPALAGWTEAVQGGYEQREYDELTRLVRTGPGRLSAFSLPGVDKFLNTTEYVIHHEDVRRAQPGWSPRHLRPAVQDALWTVVRARAPFAFRGVDTGIVLRRSGTPRSSVVASKGEPAVTIFGEPLELLLYLFGRRDHAVVKITGDPDALTALDAASLAV
jgi:uncharacterized protein (TIGR03085 family)